MVFEAHSTDYQLPEGLAALVRDSWAVLKVGPSLTFALREGLFALAAIEDQLVPEAGRSALLDVLERVMLADPGRWQRYYEGTPDEQRTARRFSYSDRMRYYLPQPEVQAAVDRLLANLDGSGVPEPLLSQYLPLQYDRVRRGLLAASPRELLLDRVRDALRPYAAAPRAAHAPAAAVAADRLGADRGPTPAPPTSSAPAPPPSARSASSRTSGARRAGSSPSAAPTSTPSSARCSPSRTSASC
jgi:D-tagatose-1,6-bisphosphate aldolase subunit GatZ/KbaZ